MTSLCFVSPSLLCLFGKHGSKSPRAFLVIGNRWPPVSYLGQETDFRSECPVNPWGASCTCHVPTTTKLPKRPNGFTAQVPFGWLVVNAFHLFSCVHPDMEVNCWTTSISYPWQDTKSKQCLIFVLQDRIGTTGLDGCKYLSLLMCNAERLQLLLIKIKTTNKYLLFYIPLANPRLYHDNSTPFHLWTLYTHWRFLQSHHNAGLLPMTSPRALFTHQLIFSVVTMATSECSTHPHTQWWHRFMLGVNNNPQMWISWRSMVFFY